MLKNLFIRCAVVYFVVVYVCLWCLAVRDAGQTCALPPGCRPSGCCAPGQRRCSPAAAGGALPPSRAAAARAAGCPTGPGGPPSPAPAAPPPAVPGPARAPQTLPLGWTLAAPPPAPPRAAGLSPGHGPGARVRPSASGWSAPAGHSVRSVIRLTNSQLCHRNVI